MLLPYPTPPSALLYHVLPPVMKLSDLMKKLTMEAPEKKNTTALTTNMMTSWAPDDMILSRAPY
jgi:hypothetical protein